VTFKTVLVQREMESRRYPLVSIARALGWNEEAVDGNCNWFQKEIRVGHSRCTWCTGHRNRCASSRRWAGVDGTGSSSKRKANWLKKEES